MNAVAPPFLLTDDPYFMSPKGACIRCGAPTKKKRAYCSRECYMTMRPRTMVERTCEQCANPFTRRLGDTPRFCSVPCADIARRKPAEFCKRCGKSPLPRSAKKYCSRECAVLDTAVVSIPCEHCKKPFERDRSRARFCSTTCASASRLSVRPACPQCGGPTKVGNRKFCSSVCQAKASRRHPFGALCLECGGPNKSRRATYCSTKCAAQKRAVPKRQCELCNAPINRKATRCVSCAYIGRVKERICAVCGGAGRKGRRTCSAVCAGQISRTLRNPAYTAETLDQLKELRASGLTATAIGARVGMTHGQVSGLLERLKIPVPAKLVRPPRVKKVKVKPKPKAPSRGRPHQSYWLSRPAKPQKTKPDTTEIDLTGLCRLAMVLREEYGVRVKDRVSFEEVTHEWRRIDPTHPGFRFKQPGNRGTVAEWRSK